MNVQTGNKQHSSPFLINRLARRIMDHLGHDHRWKESEMTYLTAYHRVEHMLEEDMVRYIWRRMRDPVNLERVAIFRSLVCETCFCKGECDVDHSAGISIRDIMIYLICEAVEEEIEEERWNYFAAAS